MKWLFRCLRTTTFLVMLCVTLATTTLSLAVWTVSLTAQVATMSASAAAAAIAHRKQLAKAVARTKARTKAKARLRRIVAAIPIAGIAAAVVFEASDYSEWQEENPDGEFEDYACEVGTVSAEVIDDVLQDLPETARPSRDFVLSQLPECKAAI